MSTVTDEALDLLRDNPATNDVAEALALIGLVTGGQVECARQRAGEHPHPERLCMAVERTTAVLLEAAPPGQWGDDWPTALGNLSAFLWEVDE